GATYLNLSQQQRVVQRRVRALEQLREIVGREAKMQHRPAELHERNHDDGGKRYDRATYDNPAIGSAEPAYQRTDVQQRRGTARAGRVMPPRQDRALDQERGDRTDHQEHAEHAGGRRIVRGLADEQFIGFDAEDRLVLGDADRRVRDIE